MRGCAGLDRQTGVPVARTTVEPPADVVGRTQLVDVMRSIPLGVILPLETSVLLTMYVGAFFTGSSNVGLLIGSITLGVAIAGGDLMWMLWVTKFAPAHRVADYMGLHTFFTGIRAVLAPLLAFAVVGVLPLPVIALTSALLMVISSAILIPEARAERRLRLELPIRVVAGD